MASLVSEWKVRSLPGRHPFLGLKERCLAVGQHRAPSYLLLEDVNFAAPVKPRQPPLRHRERQRGNLGVCASETARRSQHGALTGGFNGADTLFHPESYALSEESWPAA